MARSGNEQCTAGELLRFGLPFYAVGLQKRVENGLDAILIIALGQAGVKACEFTFHGGAGAG